MLELKCISYRTFKISDEPYKFEFDNLLKRDILSLILYYQDRGYQDLILWGSDGRNSLPLEVGIACQFYKDIRI
jgi:hypothetical protein